MKKYKFLVNASNLHVGGGVQVAVSLIDELSRMTNMVADISVIASTEVDANLKSVNADCLKFASYEVFNTYGLSALWSGLSEKLIGYDVVFTVFGPLYLWSLKAVSIVGFAQPWIIYPDNEIYRSMSFYRRLKTRIKFLIQSFFFRRADKLIVELDHVKNGLVSHNVFASDKIDIVSNCLSSLFLRPQLWTPLINGIEKTKFSIGFVGRDYPHKNTNILPEIKLILINRYGIDVDFFVTLTSSEWDAKSYFFRTNIINVGELGVSECPGFYQKMDAVIFPSFLECFSATPLEAMAMEKPLFASDRGFVRDVCGDFALYFDPTDSADAANLIASFVNNKNQKNIDKFAAARNRVIKFSNPRKRAEDYLKIMQSAAIDCTSV
ncbi:glycosyltransferase family 4 protein [Acidovorax soli]|uniref:glycosyltransferase family 4 protein n=1 Tax=Acidovorax soli TaxID=592050 RepID=UPI0032B2C0CC